MFRWIKALIGRTRNLVRPSDYRVVRLNRHPKDEEIKKQYLYLVGSGEHVKWAYLRCPCPRADVVRLNLIENQTPSWHAAINKRGEPTISPSIRQLDGCFSHFWIQSGRVIWCNDSGQPPRRKHDYLLELSSSQH